MTFDSYVEAFGATEHGFTAADRATCARIVQELQGVTARGGTELGLAIEATGALLATLPDDDREHIVLLLSDGAVGDEATAMNYRRHELSGARVITVAIGENANGFMSALAADGTCIFVEADHQVAQSAAKVVSRLATPTHRHARLVAEGLTEQAPHIAPDIYPDLVVRLTGRMARPAPGALVEVVGDDGVIAVASIELSADSSITTRWASSRIKALDADVMAARGAETVPALEKQIADLSIKHQVLSKYTAWIAVDRSRTTDTVIVRTIHQPDYGLFDDEPAGAMTHAHSLSYLRYQLPVRSIGSLWELSVNPQSPGDQWDISFDSPDVDISAIKRPKADLDVPIGTLIAELRRLVNDASSTAADMQAVLKAIEYFLLGAVPNGLVKRVGVMRLKRLMAKCTTALQKGQIDTARALMLRMADYLNDAAPDSIF